PEELLAALLEPEQQAALLVVDPPGDELRAHQRLAGPGGTRDQDDGVAEEAAAADRVELDIPRCDAQVRRLLLQLDRRQRDHDDARAGQDREWELPLLVVRAPEL